MRHQQRRTVFARALARYLLLLPALLHPVAGLAQKDENFGGLTGYPVPQSAGGELEFATCTIYAQRAWRMARLLEAKATTLPELHRLAREHLGTAAAAEEIADFDAYAGGIYATPEAMAAERFVRCARRLKLNPEPRHKGQAEFCFRGLGPLDYAAQERDGGRSKAQVAAALGRFNPPLPTSQQDAAVDLVFTGPTSSEGSSLIEDTFATCFAEAGERSGATKATTGADACRSADEVSVTLSHSMYASREAADAAYAEITQKWSNDLRLGLRLEAMSDSIDTGSKVNGGDLGTIRHGEFEARFEDAIFALPPQTLSRPIQSSFGWHLVWVDRVNDVKTGAVCPSWPRLAPDSSQ